MGRGKAPAAQACGRIGGGEAPGLPALSLRLAFGPPQPPGFEPGTPAVRLPSPCCPLRPLTARPLPTRLIRYKQSTTPAVLLKQHCPKQRYNGTASNSMARYQARYTDRVSPVADVTLVTISQRHAVHGRGESRSWSKAFTAHNVLVSTPLAHL